MKFSEWKMMREEKDINIDEIKDEIKHIIDKNRDRIFDELINIFGVNGILNNDVKFENYETEIPYFFSPYTFSRENGYYEIYFIDWFVSDIEYYFSFKIDKYKEKYDVIDLDEHKLENLYNDFEYEIESETVKRIDYYDINFDIKPKNDFIYKSFIKQFIDKDITEFYEYYNEHKHIDSNYDELNQLINLYDDWYIPKDYYDSLFFKNNEMYYELSFSEEEEDRLREEISDFCKEKEEQYIEEAGEFFDSILAELGDLYFLKSDDIEKILSPKNDEIKKYKGRYKNNPILKKIKNNILYSIADETLKKYPELKNDEKITIPQYKELRKNHLYASRIQKNIGKEFIQKYSNGYSINDIINFDKNINKLNNNSIFENLTYNKDLSISLSTWVSNTQKIFLDKKNFVFQLNIKKELWNDENWKNEFLKKFVKYGGDNIENRSYNYEELIDRYVNNSNHPTKKDTLTLAWIRFTIFNKNEENEYINDKNGYVVIDEIQTDLDNKKFRFKDNSFDGWDVSILRLFIRYVRNNLKIRKIYMPTYDTKLNIYNTYPPMYLYKQTPKEFGFKNSKENDMFMVLENKKIS